ncbi:MAG: PPOX class F420-dependent oxidoreductase [Dehalococcoidia bacterium]
MEITGRVKELIEGKNLANLGTIGPDGYPQVTPVWIDYDGTHVLVNTAEGRAKPANVRRDPRVSFSIYSTDNAYAPAFVWGKVVEITPEGARDHIDKLAKKYLDADSYPFYQGETRLILKIEPEKVRG